MSQTNIDIPQGYKQTKVGIIPEDWAVKNLASQVYIDKSNIKNDYDKEYINYVSLSDVENGIAHYNKIKFQEAPSRAKRIAPKYSVLFATVRPNLKNFGIVEDDGVVASTGFAVLEKKKANMKFIFNYLYSYQAERQFNALTVGSNYPALNSTDVKNLKLPIPPLPEQEKIADCLTIWDKAITQTKKLIDAKKQVKKGLMQQLLTGKKRLAGFTEEWKEVKLGEIGETFNGLTGKNKNDFGSGMPYVSYLNTYRNNKIDENTKFDYVNIKPTENQNRLMYGDLIFTTSSETPDEVGISSVILFEPTEYLYLNSFCFGLRLQDFSILEPKFAVFYLRGQIFRKTMYELAQGSTRFNLSKSGFRKITICIPSIKEQTAIAEILQTADKEIELLEEKLKALEQQKKGLMQVLLTGKKRLLT